MENKSFELFIKTCGSERKAGEVLNLKQQTISSMRCGRTNIHNKKAKAIVDYLSKKLGLVIAFESLITPIEKKKRELYQSTLFNELPIQISSIYLEKITNAFDKTIYQSSEKIDSDKLIIIDEFYYLISNEETYFYYLQNNKKIVKGCKINLQELVNRGLNKSTIVYISEKFDLIERTKLAQRVKSLVGNRRGNPSKKGANVGNCPHLVLPNGIKTRDFVAEFFSLGSEKTARKLKKIIDYDNKELIEQVRREEITPHAAYQQILNAKPKTSFSFRSLFRR